MLAAIITPMESNSASFTSEAINTEFIRFLSFSGALSGSAGPTASVKIQASNWAGGINTAKSNIPESSWVDISGASLSFTADAVKTSTVTQVCYRFIRFVYATTDGTPGSFTCTALLQGNA